MKTHKSVANEVERFNRVNARRFGVWLEVHHENEGLVLDAKTRAGTFSLNHQMKTGEAFRLVRALNIYETAKEAHQKEPRRPCIFGFEAHEISMEGLKP